MSILFKGKESPLSNLYILEQGLIYKDTLFNCSEQAYQWEKCMFYNNLNLAEKILKEKNPYKQMRLGGLIEGDIEWTNAKIFYMTEILKIKLINSKAYRDALKYSKDNLLIEDTCHEFWGRGKTGNGKNNLGVLHCSLRALSKICET